MSEQEQGPQRIATVADLIQLRGENARLEARVADLTGKLEAFRAVNKASVDEAKRDAARIASLESRLAESFDAHDRAVKSIGGLRVENAQVHKEVSDLKLSLQDVTRARDEVAGARDRAVRSVGQLIRERDMARDQVKEAAALQLGALRLILEQAEELARLGAAAAEASNYPEDLS